MRLASGAPRTRFEPCGLLDNPHLDGVDEPIACKDVGNDHHLIALGEEFAF
jgi:hypothetical protein